MINVTDLTGYLFCRRKVYLEKIKGIRSKPTIQMIKGKLKHNIIEFFSKGEERLITGIVSRMNDDELFELYRKNCFLLCQNVFLENSMLVKNFRIEMEKFWNEFWQSFESDTRLRVKIISALLAKGIYGQQLWESLEPKYKSELKVLSEKLGLAGRIDRLEVWKDKVIPYEIKDRIFSQPYESEMVQIAAYAMMLEEAFSRVIDEGIIQYRNKNLNVSIDEKLRGKVRLLVDELRELQNNPCPPICENFKKCESCMIKEQCFNFVG